MKRKNIQIFQRDIFELTRGMLGPVNAVCDRAALVALPKEVRVRYAAHLTELTGEAPQLLICFEYDQTCMDGPPFSVVESEVRDLYPSVPAPLLLERQQVKGGLKGKCPATEAVYFKVGDDERFSPE